MGQTMELLILELLRGVTTHPSPKNSAGPWLTALIAFLTLAGAGFLMAAGFSWLRETYDVRTASMYMGVAAIGAAAICGLVVILMDYVHKAKARIIRNAVIARVNNMVQSVVNEFDEPIRENPKTAAALASVAGFVAAEKLIH